MTENVNLNVIWYLGGTNWSELQKVWSWARHQSNRSNWYHTHLSISCALGAVVERWIIIWIFYFLIPKWKRKTEGKVVKWGSAEGNRLETWVGIPCWRWPLMEAAEGPSEPPPASKAERPPCSPVPPASILSVVDAQNSGFCDREGLIKTSDQRPMNTFSFLLQQFSLLWRFPSQAPTYRFSPLRTWICLCVCLFVILLFGCAGDRTHTTAGTMPGTQLLGHQGPPPEFPFLHQWGAWALGFVSTSPGAAQGHPGFREGFTPLKRERKGASATVVPPRDHKSER